MQNLLQTAYDLLKQDERLVSDNGELLKNKVQEVSNKLDEGLIELLLSNETMKKRFFKQIKDVYVFDNNNFIRFINNKEFLPDSYTSFKNRIGLMDSTGRFIVDTNDVLLNRPYKDCILAGGQDTEDAKRNEVFYNEVLASDEVDRLLDPKVFTNFRKYTLDGEQEVTDFTKDSKGNIKDNLIIKGNNLLVLHSLHKQFANKIKLVYIDPPYNTGGNGDSFAYNNSFKVSTWLTFMKNRIEAVRGLLSKNGSIIIAIDKWMQEYLGVLLKELFDSSKHEINCIVIQHNPSGTQGNNFSYTHEFAYFVTPKDTTYLTKVYREDVEPTSFRDRGKDSSKREAAKTCFYPILIKDSKVIGFGEVCKNDYHPEASNIFREDGIIEVYPIDGNGIERKRRFGRETVESIIDELICKKIKNEFVIQRIKNDGYRWKTIWTDERYNANVYGTKEVNQMIEGRFSYPKSLYTVKDCIKAVVHSKDDIIIDYHAGSGTTAHAVLELNKEDGGNRQFILVEQMDYIQTVTVPRVNQVIKNNGEGSFVYMEVMKDNQNFIDQINQADTKEDLVILYHAIKDSSFINYKVNIKKIDSNMSEFENLSIENMKQFLVTMLDQNALYVNYSEIKDSTNNVSLEDIALNNQFYA